MSSSHEHPSGGGEVVPDGEPSEALQYLRDHGLLTVLLARQRIYELSGGRPDLNTLAIQLGGVVSVIELVLREGGIDEEDIQRLPKSTIPLAPRDPERPRTI